MTLKEIHQALATDLHTAGLSTGSSSVTLAFTAKKNSDGTVICDFVDSAVLTKPRPEEIHRLHLSMTLTKPESVGDTAPEIPEKKRSLKLFRQEEFRRLKSDAGVFGVPVLDSGEFDSPTVSRKLGYLSKTASSESPPESR